MEELEKFKNQVAKNLVYYRKKNKLTQLELAEKLNYSDKAISKWERGESLPDLYILNSLAQFYKISVDSLIHGEKVNYNVKTEEQKRIENRKRIMITILSFLFVWFIATFIYCVLALTIGFAEKLWLVFIYAIPVSMVVVLIFNSIWGNRLMNIIPISLLSWGIIISIYLSFNIKSLWILFVGAGSFQVLIIFWYIMKGLRFPFLKKKIKKDEEV